MINFVTLKLIIMKNLRSIITVAIFLFFSYSQAQNVTYNGKEYTVNNDKIYFEDKDITATLTVDQITDIKNRLNENLAVEKRIKIAEKEKSNAEKKQKQAEKKQNQAERALKKMQNEESALVSYQKKYQKEFRQYEKLKKKRKLAPVDEEKWQKKLKTLEEKIEKSKKRLNRY
jgi:hypothetical protein